MISFNEIFHHLINRLELLHKNFLFRFFNHKLIILWLKLELKVSLPFFQIIHELGRFFGKLWFEWEITSFHVWKYGVYQYIIRLNFTLSIIFSTQSSIQSKSKKTSFILSLFILFLVLTFFKTFNQLIPLFAGNGIFSNFNILLNIEQIIRLNEGINYTKKKIIIFSW